MCFTFTPSTLEEDHHKDGCTIHPSIDEHTFPVRGKTAFLPQALMFVGDLLTGGPRQRIIDGTPVGLDMQRLVAASIESGSIIISCPGAIYKPLLPPYNVLG